MYQIRETRMDLVSSLSNLFSASAESLPTPGRSAVVALALNEGERVDWVLQVQPTALECVTLVADGPNRSRLCL